MNKNLKLLYIGFFLSSLGSGLTLPYLVIYLHEIRGFALSTSGYLVAYMAIVGLVVAGPVGTLVDKYGPRKLLLFGILTQIIAVWSISFIESLYFALVVLTLLAIGNGAVWPPQSTLIARLATSEERSKAFSIQFLILNLGLGIGGIFSSFLVKIDDAKTFELLYRIDGSSYIFYFLIVLFGLKRIGGPISAKENVEKNSSYIELWKDKKLRRLIPVLFMFSIFGYGSIEVGFPAFATQVVGVEPAIVGWSYAANTLVIVFFQLITLKLTKNKSRISILMITGAIWIISWVFLGLSSYLALFYAILFLILSSAVFAIGETFYSTTAQPLLNDLAPEELRGRYNSLGGISWNVGGVIGPGISGAMLGADLNNQWIFLIILGCFLGILGARTMRPLLSVEQDGRLFSKSN